MKHAWSATSPLPRLVNPHHLQALSPTVQMSFPGRSGVGWLSSSSCSALHWLPVLPSPQSTTTTQTQSGWTVEAKTQAALFAVRLLNVVVPNLFCFVLFEVPPQHDQMGSSTPLLYLYNRWDILLQKKTKGGSCGSVLSVKFGAIFLSTLAEVGHFNHLFVTCCG